VTESRPLPFAGRTVTLRSAQGDTILAVDALPAAILLAAAVATAPRLTAAAAVGALFRRLSLSLDR